jgi:hypothetical protein
VLLWQAPTLLNPHFATGTKDELGAQVFYDALARFDADGVLEPILAAEIPSRENGGVAADGRSVDLEAQARRHLARRQRRSPPTTSSSTGSSPPTPRPRRPRSARSTT